MDKGGTIKQIDGQVPTDEEAKALIGESKGKVERVDPGHRPPNPHTYRHINYTTKSGKKGTIRVQKSAEKKE